MKGARSYDLACIALFAICGGSAHAQTRPALAARSITLAPPDAKLEIEFSSVRAIRELSDGRVLVTDQNDNRLVVVDFRTQSARAIGRPGAGPGEVRHFGRLYALGGDSTLLTDEPDGRRWLILAGDSIVATLPPDHPMIRMSSGAPRGTDRAGNIVLLRNVRQIRTEHRSGMRLVDSAAVLFVDRRTARADTTMRVLYTDQRVQVVGTRERPGYIFRQAHFSSVESVSMSPDGWVAVASQSPFRVIWRTPEGRLVRGPDLAWPRFAVDANEKRALAARTLRLTGYPLAAQGSENWVEVIPPFGGAFPALHTPEGRLLLRKFARVGAEGTRYDVIDREGRPVGAIELPETDWLVGFGRRAVYSVTRDEDGIQWLRRHPWP